MPETTATQLPSALQSDLAQFFRLLADETRLRVVVYLMQEGELHVSALCDRLGQSQPAVSHHLAMLRLGDVLRVRRDGKFNYYALSGRRVSQLLKNIFTSAGEGRGELQFAGLSARRLGNSPA